MISAAARAAISTHFAEVRPSPPPSPQGRHKSGERELPRSQPGAQIGRFCQSEVSLIHCSVSGADRWTVVNAADGASISRPIPIWRQTGGEPQFPQTLVMPSQDTARWAAWQKFTATVEMGSA